MNCNEIINKLRTTQNAEKDELVYLLKNITAVANNLTIPSPTGITTYGSPSVLVENLSVAGK